MKKICKRCGEAIENRMPNATLCWSCSNQKVRVASGEKKRAGNFSRIVIDGKVYCVDCKTEIVPLYKRTAGAPMRCISCKKDREKDREFSSAAHRIVAKAIRAGEIKKPSSFACADCGKPAECYDHRDYSKPLEVVAVCLSCNVIRGPADRRAA